MKSFFTFYLTLLFFSSIAQEPGFKLYTTKDGLVGNQVWGIKQDAKGFLWLATTEGVSRFDGLKFKNFTKNNGLTNSLIPDIDFSGDTVFVLGRNVIDIIVNDSVIKYYEEDKIKINEFLRIDGRLYAYCEKVNNNKVFLLDVAKRTLTNNFNEVLNTGKNNRLFITKTNTYKIINGKIYRFGKNNTLQKLVISKLSEYDNLISFFINSNGCAYVITKKDKSNEVADKLIFIDSLGDVKKRYDLSAIYNQNEFNLVLPVSDHLIILLDSRGYIYVLNNNKTYKINFNFYTCNKIINDYEGNTWIATDRGLVKLLYKEFLNFPASSGYPEDVWGIFPENKDKIWFNSYSSGLHCFENGKCIKRIEYIDKNRLVPYFAASKGFNNDFVIPNSPGIIVYNVQNHSFKLLYKNKDKACLFTAVDGVDKKIIFGSMSDLYALNKDYSFDSICSIKNFGSSKTILSCVRRNNNYYLACSGNILEFNIATKKGKWFNLKNVRFNSIVNDYKNNLWAASDEGIYFFTPKDTLHFFSNENFMALIIDKKNCLFAVNNKGLYKLDLVSYYKNKKADFEFYGEDEGFSGAGDQNAFFMDDEGSLWIPGSENSVKIIPSQLEVKKITLQPLIEEVYASDNSNSLIPLLKSESHTLNYDFKNIHFGFLAVCLSSPGKVKYQYRLTGYNDTWSEPSDKREASYTNLSHGNYIFELRASCNSNFDKAPIVKFLFTITPPFWQKWWFYTISIIAFSILVIIIFRWQLQRIKKKERLNQKVAQLEMDLLRMQIDPHYIGNSLEVIKSFISKNKTEDAQTAINSFGFMLRFIAETTKKSSIPLEKEFQMLKNYVAFQKLKCGDSFDFITSVAEDIDISDISIPPLLIQPFVENAIIHGLKHKESKALPDGRRGIIQIKVQQKNNEFLNIIIADNGVGRINSGKLNSNVKEHKSVGIENAKERLKIFNKTSSGNIEFNDKPDGTEVIIALRK